MLLGSRRPHCVPMVFIAFINSIAEELFRMNWWIYWENLHEAVQRASGTNWSHSTVYIPHARRLLSTNNRSKGNWRRSDDDERQESKLPFCAPTDREEELAR